MRHRKAAEDDFAAVDIQQDAAVGFVRPPPARRVGLTERRDIAWLAVAHRKTIEMAAIFGAYAVTKPGRQRG